MRRQASTQQRAAGKLFIVPFGINLGLIIAATEDTIVYTQRASGFDGSALALT